MKKYDDTVYLPYPPTFTPDNREVSDYLRKSLKVVKRELEIIHDIGNLNIEQPAAFSAHKNGTDQTGIATSTWTKLTWSTEIFDINSELVSSIWTPGRRVIRIIAGATFISLADGTLVVLGLYKNGSLFKRGSNIAVGAAGSVQITDSWIDKADGDDYYEIYVWHNHGSNRDIDGDAARTYFMGY